MTYNEWVGTIGVGLILIAYFLNTFGWIHPNGKLFFLINALGAGLACYASLLINFWPFVILEGVWLIISLTGLSGMNMKNAKSVNQSTGHFS